MKSVARVMSKLTSKFQPEAAVGMDTLFQILIEDDSPYQIQIRDQQCIVAEGEHDDPDVTLIMDSQTFCDIIEGELGGTSAYLSGRVRAEGNIMLATKLGSLFKR